MLPTVSIVIPCKGSERTIRAAVDSFLGQDYPALSELILVGDVNDSTWEALADVRDSRLVLIEQEHTPGRRDPNVKRDKGIRKSAGDVIALADSDIVVDPGWLGRAVGLLNGQGGGLVAGGIRSINDTFWGRFVDNNVMAAKTPRVPRPYRVTAKNFGARGCKPPITANAVFTRDLYDSVQLDIVLGVRVRGLRVVLAAGAGGPPHPVRLRADRLAPPPPLVPPPGPRVPPVRARLRAVHPRAPGLAAGEEARRAGVRPADPGARGGQPGRARGRQRPRHAGRRPARDGRRPGHRAGGGPRSLP